MVRFEHVTFGYQNGRRPAVLDCSFELRPGATLGVVGPSGAGKSTLVNLLLRFADPQQGRVLLDGHDLRELPLDLLRRQVAVVAQDTYLFYGTVAENLRVASPEATQAELETACRAANAHDFIAALPRGYDTLIGERGVRLSGGQRQRVSIARALLKDAPILVLDEALSSVDAESESTIQQALERLQRGRTTLVIAHRLSSVATADRIIVLERGRLVEEGAPNELMARTNGVYQRLMAAQQTIVVDDVDVDFDGSSPLPPPPPTPPTPPPPTGAHRPAPPPSSLMARRHTNRHVEPPQRRVKPTLRLRHAPWRPWRRSGTPRSGAASSSSCAPGGGRPSSCLRSAHSTRCPRSPSAS